MSEIIAEQLFKIIPKAAELYHRLILVVAPSGTGKTVALKQTGKNIGTSILNVNLELSRQMLDLTEKQRPLKVSRLLDDAVNSIGGDVILLDNIEILFETSLKQDPLRLLQGLSRNKTVVAAWNGSIDGDHMIYAVPDHPEYRRYMVRDFLVASPEVTT